MRKEIRDMPKPKKQKAAMSDEENTAMFQRIMGRTWQDLTSQKMKGFTGAETVLRSPSRNVYLVKWDHEHARGWYSYVVAEGSSVPKFYLAAGGESTTWTEQQAQDWARLLFSGSLGSII